MLLSRVDTLYLCSINARIGHFLINRGYQLDIQSEYYISLGF